MTDQRPSSLTGSVDELVEQLDREQRGDKSRSGAGALHELIVAP
jgi:hypothetical protein